MIQTLGIIEDLINKLTDWFNRVFVEPIIGSLLNFVNNIFRHIWATICNTLYGLIATFYNVIVTIPKMDILSEVGVQGIYQRMTMMLTIIMTFYIVFQVVKYVVQPDSVLDKEKGAGNVAFKLIGVILLIAFVPRIFTLAYDLQGKIIDGGIVNKIILGDTSPQTNPGGNFTANLFSVFYGVNPAVCKKEGGWIREGQCQEATNYVEANMAIMRNNWNDPFDPIATPVTQLMLHFGIDMMSTANDGSTNAFVPVIYFEGLLAIAMGIYILVTLMKYGVEVAKRQFQLIYLQVTAPIAIIGFLSPKKDNPFSKWLQQCITTYLDLFFRLITLNFVMLIMDVLHDAIFQGESASREFIGALGAANNRISVLAHVYLFMIIGLFQFMKKAPKLLKELLPQGNAASGDFSFAGIDDAKNIVRAVGGTVGSIGAVKGALNSETLKGASKADRGLAALRAGFNAAQAGYGKGGTLGKARAAGRSSIAKDEDVIVAGGTVTGARFGGHKAATDAQAMDRQIKRDEDIAKAKDSASTLAKGHKMMGYVADNKRALEEKNWGDADSLMAYSKKMEKALRTYSVTRDDGAAESAIVSATTELYNSQRRNIENNASARIEAARSELAAAAEKRDFAKGELTALTTEYKTKNPGASDADVAAYIDTVAQARMTEYQEKEKQIEAEITKIETEKRAQMIEVNMAEEQAISTATAKLYDDNQKLNDLQVTIQTGMADSSGAEYEKDGVAKTVANIKDIESAYVAANPGASQADIQAHLAQFYAEYAADMGDIEDAAKGRITAMKASSEYRKAKANAAASGKN